MKSDYIIDAFVPARGGSKGIKDKNLQILGGCPLVAWPILMAKQCDFIRNIYLSTDEPRIARAGENAGAEILKRPDELSKDRSTVTSMLDYHFATLEKERRLPDYLVYLEPTSPFRTPNLIKEVVSHCILAGVDSAATFKGENFHPSWLLREEDGKLHKYSENVKYSQHNGREDAIFALSGAVYVFSVHSYLKQRPSGIFFGNWRHVIESDFSIDIDTPLELAIARAMLPRLKEIREILCKTQKL